MAPKGKEKNHKERGPDPKVLCDEAAGHLKTGNYKKSLHAYNMALELNPNDKNALVARSRCYLLLGEPQLALQDAETALKSDKNYIRAIFQKAEALYHMGDFEHSLMYYHRGLRLRPELQGFRLGVQKAQEAIENIIGKRKLTAGAIKKKVPSSSSKRIHQQSRRLLGELCVDKEYLEQLLKHPDIKCESQQDEKIASFAKEGVDFLSKREEFWRQQQIMSFRVISSC